MISSIEIISSPPRPFSSPLPMRISWQLHFTLVERVLPNGQLRLQASLHRQPLRYQLLGFWTLPQPSLTLKGPFEVAHTLHRQYLQYRRQPSTKLTRSDALPLAIANLCQRALSILIAIASTTTCPLLQLYAHHHRHYCHLRVHSASASFPVPFYHALLLRLHRPSKRLVHHLELVGLD